MPANGEFKMLGNLRTVLRFLTIAVTGYALLTGCLYLGQRRLMYFPDRAVPDKIRSGVPEMETIRLRTEDGLSLLAWFRPPARPDKATIVYFHGNGGHIGYRGGKARPYLEAGYGVLLLSWRGYGGNEGEPSEEGFYRDGRAALDALANRGTPADRIVLYGESLGTGVAVQMATERRLGALVLESPFTSITAVVAQHYWYLPTSYLVRDKYDSLAKIGRIGVPLLVVHGERDGLIPVSIGEELFAAAPEPKTIKIVPGACHNELYAHGAAAHVLAFLAATFSAPSPPPDASADPPQR